jgi:hypothetical protein
MNRALQGGDIDKTTAMTLSEGDSYRWDCLPYPRRNAIFISSMAAPRPVLKVIHDSYSDPTGRR